MSNPTLQIQTPVAGFSMPLTHVPVTIGREDDNQIHFDDKLLDAHHCIIVLIQHTPYVVDLRSAGGSYINGTRISYAPLNPGEVLRIGDIKITATGGQPVAKPDARPLPTLDATAVSAEDSGVSVVHASDLKYAVTGMDDSGMHIKVIPDEELDMPVRIAAPRYIGELMLPRDIDKQFRDYLKQHAGLMIICGPEHSGRTTTAYAMLRHLLAAKRKIATFEQPPEFQLDGAYQVFVHNEKEYLKQFDYVMKHGAEVMYLGEQPDKEVLDLALRAAMGRSLVIVNWDGEDVVRVLDQWVEMGVSGKKLAQAFRLAIGQQLIHRLCDQCKTPVDVTSEHKEKLGPFMAHIDHIYEPDACPNCNNIGFTGEIAVYEMLRTSEALQAALRDGDTVESLRHRMDVKHYVPMRLSTYARVAQGRTTLAEADKLVAQLKTS